MQLEPQACYRALRTRDARFDGRFFTAVRSTGVFCRPVCPAPCPRLENCTFVPSAAAARELGYRPCLRCRPEASPGTPAWLGTSATVSRALRLISEGALDHGSVDALAERLGVGARHLRRLFLQHLGAPPLAVAQTQRLLFAKKLIDETRLPLGQVALASGFASVRRFNATIRQTYRRTPGDLRRASGKRSRRDGAELVLRLPYRAPLAWDVLLGYLAGRAIPGVEAVRAGRYARTVRVRGAHGWLEVTAEPAANQLAARIHLPDASSLIEVAERLRRVFDLGADPHEITSHLRGDPLLGPRLRRLPGLRVPGAWDGFELAVRAVLGQQVTVRGATTLAGRLAASYGEKLADELAEQAPAGLRYLFPGPEVLADADLAQIGLPKARAAALRGLAAAVASGELALDASLGLEETVARLCELPGIGEWTAQYIAMRALREPDAFPAGDLGLRKALAAPGAKPLSSAALARAAESWRPWRAYAAVALWLGDPKSGQEKE